MYIARLRKGDNNEEGEKTMDPEGDATAQRARFIVLTVGREGKHTEEQRGTGLSCLALERPGAGLFIRSDEIDTNKYSMHEGELNEKR
jgi:hypothetical protein